MTANPIRPISQFASGILASLYNPPGAYLIFGDGSKAIGRVWCTCRLERAAVRQGPGFFSRRPPAALSIATLRDWLPRVPRSHPSAPPDDTSCMRLQLQQRSFPKTIPFSSQLLESASLGMRCFALLGCARRPWQRGRLRKIFCTASRLPGRFHGRAFPGNAAKLLCFAG
jgi:hypothetical protein